MESIHFQWLHSYPRLKLALGDLLGSSGQQLKKFYTSRELSHPVKKLEITKIPLDLVNHLRINPIFTGADPFIIREHPDYLVIHKPPFIHCHPHRYSDENSLINYLASIGEWEVLRVNEQAYDRGLLFRLDFETSGVLLVAKNQGYFEKIRSGFKNSMKRKIYWAIVEGEFNAEGEWQHFFQASGVKGHRQKVSDSFSQNAQGALLEVKTLLKQNGKSLVMINLKTGLRHQIRAQLSALGFPILGDELYGAQKAARLYLHALRYDWDEESALDVKAELFEGFFDLNRALQMTHDMLRVL
jgi:23S rRNA pseudouridine1911/1915/1917 synthase